MVTYQNMLCNVFCVFRVHAYEPKFRKLYNGLLKTINFNTFIQRTVEKINFSTVIFYVQVKSQKLESDAPMGIRTPVAGVRVLHDWPCYTIGALRYLL